jgi:hypothetical protein
MVSHDFETKAEQDSERRRDAADESRRDKDCRKLPAHRSPADQN